MKLGKRPQRPTKCFCNGAMTSWFKVLSSFNVFVRGTGRGFEKAPLQKHKRCGQLGGSVNRYRLTNRETEKQERFYITPKIIRQGLIYNEKE
jgi:hypothetical protein